MAVWEKISRGPGRRSGGSCCSGAVKEHDAGEAGAGRKLDRPDRRRALAAALDNNATLTSLDLTANDIDAEGARALTSALDNNATLATLNLTRNNIGAEGAGARAAARVKASTLLIYQSTNRHSGPCLWSDFLLDRSIVVHNTCPPALAQAALVIGHILYFPGACAVRIGSLGCRAIGPFGPGHATSSRSRSNLAAWHQLPGQTFAAKTAPCTDGSNTRTHNLARPPSNPIRTFLLFQGQLLLVSLGCQPGTRPPPTSMTSIDKDGLSTDTLSLKLENCETYSIWRHEQPSAGRG
jgi:hypothetical protein